MKMRGMPVLTVSILFALSVPRPGIAQIRTNRATRDTRGRKTYEYDEQNSGAFPARAPHFFKRRKVHSAKKKSVPAKEIENESYLGYSFSLSLAPFYQSVNAQLSFTYLQNNNPSVYHGSFNANELSNYYPEFNGSIEGGRMKGLFYVLSAGGTPSLPNIFHEDFSFGKHFVAHNNRWRFSPLIAFGYISSNVPFPQTVDNSTDVSIFGTAFPHMTRSNSSVTYSDKISVYMFNRSSYIKLQATVSPRIKNDFPLRFTIGYRVTVTKDLEIDIKSPTASSSYSWTAAGINFSNGNASADHSLSYNGIFFELTWVFKAHTLKQF